MSARDELATKVHDLLHPGAYREDPMTWPRHVFEVTDGLIAAGYRKVDES